MSQSFNFPSNSIYVIHHKILYLYTWAVGPLFGRSSTNTLHLRMTSFPAKQTANSIGPIIGTVYTVYAYAAHKCRVLWNLLNAIDGLLPANCDFIKNFAASKLVWSLILHPCASHCEFSNSIVPLGTLGCSPPKFPHSAPHHPHAYNVVAACACACMASHYENTNDKVIILLVYYCVFVIQFMPSISFELASRQSCRFCFPEDKWAKGTVYTIFIVLQETRIAQMQLNDKIYAKLGFFHGIPYCQDYVANPSCERMAFRELSVDWQKKSWGHLRRLCIGGESSRFPWINVK